MKACYQCVLFLFLLTPIIIFHSCTTEAPVYEEPTAKTLSYNIDGIKYRSGNWDHPNYTDPFSTFGNHRFLIETSPDDTLVQAIIPWRRHDPDPGSKDVIIIDTTTMEEVSVKRILDVSNESGHIIFKPNSGQQHYYLYYLPHESTGGYYPKLKYINPKPAIPELAALKDEEAEKLPIASVLEAQSIDDFHSFYPMEIIATRSEVDSFLNHHQRLWYLFPEYRDYPIAMTDYLPHRWIELPYTQTITDNASLGEYFTFQVGLFSPTHSLDNIKVSFSNLTSENGSVIPSETMTCFNTEGVDLNGKSFTIDLDVPQLHVQPLWMGIDVPNDIKSGTYKSTFIISAEGLPDEVINLTLNIRSETITNHGDDTPEHMTRLRWLNSTIGTGTSFIVPPFQPVKVEQNKIKILGRTITLGNKALPRQIQSSFAPTLTSIMDEEESILAAPIKFEIELSDGSLEEIRILKFQYDQPVSTYVGWKAEGFSDLFHQHITGKLEYDGMLNYEIQLVAKENVSLNDIRLEIPYNTEASEYMLGLGRKGGKRPKSMDWNWDINFHHEGLWLGGVNKGLQYVLRDENYERPLNTNFYHNKPLILPSSWGNEGKGGIRIRENDEVVTVTNYSGPRIMQQGDTLHYNIRFLITPFKLIDTEQHFATRFVHKYVPVDTAIAYGGTVINVHHANKINPYINYPFFGLEKQKAYIDEAHSKGVKVKLYNTIRELTYRAHELFALRSLGHEIFNDGEGGGHGWLQEHLVSNYHSAWHATRVNDAAILNKGTSRWTNYYIEGLNWLAQNQEIDGLYLDDIAFSRETVKRIVNVLHTHRDEVIIDLHSANQFNERDGFINSAFLYMEHFPYVTRLWFGEYFDYDADPDYWMTEVAGIPFGLPGEMLEKGGHPYRGLLYGMTTRVYGKYSPEAIWEIFDDYDIGHSQMLGYWIDEVPIKIEHPKLKSTLYLHEDHAVLAIASWSDKNESVTLDIAWDALPFNQASVSCFSPELKDMQERNEYDLHKPIIVPANEGLILVFK
ncbi:MAG: hypothetical protein HKN68_13890 [Saprospiraceae bacterium]|nr:hypothetical protein [Saprospiraceae bacterium]